MTSPAEQYARSRARQAHPVLAEFSGLYDFVLDDFQLEACRAVEDGHGVLVAAPTGSGKTLVGEFAVHMALATGRKCFYTTPIKALSNQKYADLVDRYGAEKVGLLTGDNTVNGEAPVVVMTTEVLRNMLYAGSRTLTDLGFVVMDEVHYLADRFRGPVWEEVIIHLPESVSVISLSATVSNAEEFGDWLRQVRGDTRIIVEERRPVPLYQHVLVGRRLLDLFAEGATPPRSTPSWSGSPATTCALPAWAGSSRAGRPSWPWPAARTRADLRTGAPADPELDAEPDRRRGTAGAGRLATGDRVHLQPAGCAAAVEPVPGANLRLTSPSEEAEIRAYVEQACADIPDEDLHVLGYHDFAEGLARGIASHHAGLLPTFKECVEELFSRGSSRWCSPPRRWR
jgi:ATP-dependent RNA helicase HelY